MSKEVQAGIRSKEVRGGLGRPKEVYGGLRKCKTVYGGLWKFKESKEV